LPVGFSVRFLLLSSSAAQEKPMRMSIIAISAILFLTGCATARPKASAPVESRRDRNSLPEKRAAYRASDPILHAEEEERRWGSESHRQFKDDQRRRKAARTPENRPGVDLSKRKDDGKRKE
jgi:hypothetical protein